MTRVLYSGGAARGVSDGASPLVVVVLEFDLRFMLLKKRRSAQGKEALACKYWIETFTMLHYVIPKMCTSDRQREMGLVI